MAKKGMEGMNVIVQGNELLDSKKKVTPKKPRTKRPAVKKKDMGSSSMQPKTPEQNEMTSLQDLLLEAQEYINMLPGTELAQTSPALKQKTSDVEQLAWAARYLGDKDHIDIEVTIQGKGQRITDTAQLQEIYTDESKTLRQEMEGAVSKAKEIFQDEERMKEIADTYKNQRSETLAFFKEKMQRASNQNERAEWEDYYRKFNGASGDILLAMEYVSRTGKIASHLNRTQLIEAGSMVSSLRQIMEIERGREEAQASYAEPETPREESATATPPAPAESESETESSPSDDARALKETLEENGVDPNVAEAVVEDLKKAEPLNAPEPPPMKSKEDVEKEAAEMDRIMALIGDQGEKLDAKIPSQHRSWFKKISDWEVGISKKKWAGGGDDGTWFYKGKLFGKEMWIPGRKSAQLALRTTFVGFTITGTAVGMPLLVGAGIVGGRAMGALTMYALASRLIDGKHRDTHYGRAGRGGAFAAGILGIPWVAQHYGPEIMAAATKTVQTLGLDKAFEFAKYLVTPQIAEAAGPTNGKVPGGMIINPLLMDEAELPRNDAARMPYAESALPDEATLPRNDAARMPYAESEVPPMNPLLMGNEAPLHPIEKDLPAPSESPAVRAEEFPRGGQGVASPEPPAEMARYFPDKITVKSGDTVWGIIEKQLGANGSAADVAARVNYLKGLPLEQLKAMGLGAWDPRIDGFMIQPGQTLDFSSLDTLPPPGGAAAVAPAGVPSTPSAMPEKGPYSVVSPDALMEMRMADIKSLYGSEKIFGLFGGDNGLKIYEDYVQKTNVNDYFVPGLEGTGAKSAIPGLSPEQAQATRSYLESMNRRYGIPLEGPMGEFMNKVAAARATGK